MPICARWVFGMIRERRPATFDRMDDMFLHTSEHRLQAAETEKRLDLARGIPANHPIMQQHDRGHQGETGRLTRTDATKEEWLDHDH